VQEVNANFRRIIEPDIYPDEYVGLVLSEEELRALTRALLERLQWDPGGAIISALGQTLRLEVVPPLLSVTRSSARTEVRRTRNTAKLPFKRSVLFCSTDP